MGAFGGLDAPDAGEEDGGELTEEQKAIVALSARVDALSDEAVRAEAAKRGIETEDYDGTPLEIAEIRQNLAELLASSKNVAGELADVAPAPAAQGGAEAPAAAEGAETGAEVETPATGGPGPEAGAESAPILSGGGSEGAQGEAVGEWLAEGLWTREELEALDHDAVRAIARSMGFPTLGGLSKAPIINIILSHQQEVAQLAEEGRKPAAEQSADDLSGKTMQELRRAARELGISPAGDKAHLAARIREAREKAGAYRVERRGGKLARVPTGEGGYGEWSEGLVRAEAEMRGLKGVNRKTPIDTVRRKLEEQDRRSEQGRRLLANTRNRTFNDPFLNAVFPDGKSIIRVPSQRARERARKDSGAPQVGGEWDGFDIGRFPGLGDKFRFVDSDWTPIDERMQEAFEAYYGLGMEDSAASGRDRTPDAFWDLLEQAAKTERKVKAHYAEQATEGRQAERFAHDALTERGGKETVQVQELAVGDKVVVRGQQLTVTEVDPDSGEATLSDGSRYGEQSVDDGKTLHVEMVSTRAENAAAAAAGVPDKVTLHAMKREDLIAQMRAEGVALPEAAQLARMAKPLLVAKILKHREARGIAQAKEEDGGFGFGAEGGEAGERGEAAPALVLEGASPAETAAEEKRRLEREEMQRRIDAPLDGGKPLEVGQSLMDLGGAEGGGDLFNRVARREEPGEGPRTAPPRQDADADGGLEARDAIVPQGMQNDLGTIKLDVAEHFRENAPDGVEIVGIDFHGSRLRGDAREDSDLDAVVEYRGDASEDSLFNLLNDEPLVVDGVQVDINPIRADKTGTLEAFMARSRKYDGEKAEAALPRGAEAGNVGSNQQGESNDADHIRGREDEAQGGPGGEADRTGGLGDLGNDEGGLPEGGPGDDGGSRAHPDRGGDAPNAPTGGAGLGENADGTGNGPDGGGVAGAQVDERVAGGAGGKRAGRGGRGGGRNDGRGSVREPGVGGDVGVGDGTAVRGGRSGRPVQAGEAGGGAGGAGGVPETEGGRRGNAENHVIDDPDFLDAGGAKAKFRDNLAALRVLKTLREEGREATLEERAVIAKYVGWGRSEFRNGLFGWGREWEKEREELKELIGREAFESARESTLTAFWTPPRVAQAVWRALERLGFKGGRIHEPGIGTGIFFGTMPEEVRDRSQLSGADKDVLAAEIARQLYPGARISTGAFQEENLPDGFYDLVVGNFPFADITIRRDKYNRVSANLHDYFWLKSLGIVRPGGLVAAITSTGTMDKGNDAVRREIAAKADVVACIRLPEGTFSGVAGTEVVTDLIILRKREAGEEMSEDTKAWLETVRCEEMAPGNEYLPGRINRYYQLHPERIAGRLTGTHNQYGHATTVKPVKGENVQERLGGLLAGLPENLYAPRASRAEAPKTATAAELGVDAAALRDGTLVAKDGQIWENTPQGLVQVKGTPPQKRKARLLIELRDVLNALRTAETTDGSDEQLAALRKELNRRYDAFAKEYGPLNKKGMLGLMANDPSSHMLLALERSYNPDTGKAAKADIFTSRVGYAKSRATHAENYEQAAGFSMNETGHLDAARVGEMMGVDTETAERELLRQGLAFRAPDGRLVGADEYLSGNVRDKLRQAEAAAEVDPAFTPNAEALRKVLPADKGPGDITANLGSTWIPADIMEAFSKHVLGLPEMEKGLVFEYSHALGRWTVSLPKDRYASSRIEHSSAFTNTYATRNRDFIDILCAALDDQSIRVTHKDPYTGKSTFDPVESAEANDKAEKLKDAFLAWVWKDKERAARLVRLYNDTFNGFVERKKGGRWLSFPGIAPSIKPRPHQVAAVEKLLACRRLLMAHEVGTGKTITYGLMAQKAKETGVASKPLLVVKNSTIQQVATEIQRLFPNMNIFVGGESMTAARRKRSMAQIANNNWDLVILTHDNLGSLDTDPAVERKFIDGQITELRAAADAAMNSGMAKKDIDRIRRNLLKRIATLEERLKGLLESRKTDGVSTFQDLGFDMVMVDECQAFKKLPIATYRTRVKGIPVEGSKRASALLMNVQNLVDNNPEACVVFGSGTPLDNSLVEAYVWQRYLQNDLLRNAGITSFDAWASNFGRTTSDLEMSPSGGDWKEVERFKEFVNLGELSSMMRQNMDVVFARDTGEIVRPKRHDTDDLTAQSEISKAVTDELEARASELKTKGGKPGKGDDNMLVICGDGRKAAVHPGLYKAEYAGVKGTKADACIARVARNHKADPKAAQMIFCDCGVNDTPWGFNLYRYLRDGLVEAGFEPGQVAFFSSSLSPNARAALAERMNNGEILVAIGSTDTMGTGINAQKRLRWMHHLDASRMMTPGSIEQRNGRGHRQGNGYKDVESVYYIQERSLDTFTWNLIKNKAGFINAFLRGENLGTIEEESDTIPADQFVAISSGDPRVFRKAKVEKQLHRLHLQEAAFQQSQADLEEDRRTEEWKVRNAEKEIGALEGAVELAAATTGKPFSAEVARSGVLPASTHAERSEALSAALDAAVEATASRLEDAGTGVRETVAKYRGFELQVGWEGTERDKQLRYYLRMPDGSGVAYYLSPNFDPNDKKTQMLAVFRSADAVIGGLKRKLQNTREERETIARRVEELSAGLGRKFDGAEKIAALKAELRQLNDALSGKDKEKKQGGNAPVEGAPVPLAKRGGGEGAAAVSGVDDSEDEAVSGAGAEELKKVFSRFIPGVKFVDTPEGWKNRGQALTSKDGRTVIGAFDPRTGEVYLNPNGIGRAAIPHEVGWHAVVAWARKNDRRFYNVLMDAVRRMPPAILRDVETVLAERYPGLKRGTADWLDEAGAFLYERVNRDGIDKAFAAPGQRFQWRKVAKALLDAWRAMLRALGFREVDRARYEKMAPEQVMQSLFEDAMAGRRLGRYEGAESGGTMRKAGKAKQAYYEVPFVEKLREVVKPGSNVTDNIFVRDTPKALRDIGLAALPIMASARHLRLNYYDEDAFQRSFGKLRKNENAHGLGVALEALPKLLERPIAILPNYAENAKPGSVVVLTGMTRKGGRVVVPVLIEAQARADGLPIDSHLVLTVYSKPNWVEKFVKPAIAAEKKGIGVFYVDAQQAGEVMPLSGLVKGGLMSSVVHKINDPGSPVKGAFKTQPDTIQFKRWFGDSKVVDANGKPLVVYHGTNSDIPAFDPARVGENYGQDEEGFFFTDSEENAWNYADDKANMKDEGEPNVIPVYLSLQNPLVIDAEADKTANPDGEPNLYFDSHKDEILSRMWDGGHDGLIVRGANGERMFMATDPTQVKHATENIGTFDGGNNRIRFRIGGLYTGSAADYANRREDGTIENGPSLVHIGSGEGSQVYGWGLYASDRRGVAKSYARGDAEKKGEPYVIYNGRKYTSHTPSVVWDVENTAMQHFLSNEGQIEDAISDVMADYEEVKFYDPDRAWNREHGGLSEEQIAQEMFLEKVWKFLEQHGKELQYVPANKAHEHIYEQTFFTNRATPEETERHLLKWYEPVSEEQRGWILAQLEKEGRATPYLKEALADAKTGQAVYELLAEELVDPDGFIQERTQHGTGAKLGQQSASEFLARAGIDGVKYPVGSFGKTVKNGDKAGWNYVSFRDDNIKVNHKWRDGEMMFRLGGKQDAPAPFGVDEARQRPRARGTTLAEWREAVVVEEPATLKGSGKNAGKEVPNKDAGKFRIVLPAAEGRRGAVLAGGYESAAAAASELLMYQAGFAETEKALARLPKAKLQEVLRARERAARMLSDLSATKGQHYAHALRAMKALGIPEKFQVKAAKRLQAMVEADGANRTELSELRVMKYIDGTLSREAAKAEYRELLKTLNERLPPGRKGETGEIYRARNVAMPELQKIPGMLAMDAGEVARRLARMEAELGAYENFKSGLSENESGLDEDSFRNLQWEQYLLRSFGGLAHDPNLLRVIAAREALATVLEQGRKQFLAEEDARATAGQMAALRMTEQLKDGERVPDNTAEMQRRREFGKTFRQVLNGFVLSFEAGRTLAERMDRRRGDGRPVPRHRVRLHAPAHAQHERHQVA